MAEVFGAVVAGAQVVDYTFQICDAINNIANAAGNRRRYQTTSQQLKEIIEQIRDSPHLQTPLIIRLAEHLIKTINDAHERLCRQRRNQLIASVLFVIQQKKFASIFDDFEKQKANLALYIAQLNTDQLGEIAPTVNKIWTRIQSFPEQPMADRGLDKEEQYTSSSIRECHCAGDCLDINGHGNVGTTVYHPIEYFHDQDFYDTQRDLSCRADALTPLVHCEVNDKHDDTSSPPEYYSPVKEKGLLDIPPEIPLPNPRCSSDDVTQALSPSRPSPPTSRPVTELKANYYKGCGIQTIGLNIGTNTSKTEATDAEILRITSGFRAYANVCAGDGKQVIGQLVKAGATPRQFSGHYCNNYHKGSGDQVIGISFE
ncbi:hypothetical protein F4808DRAFT_415581 [Astrocystis sublimbata]|nr:hypothetical protein F4808DRAFT_415581 [Astrocystis sublimbata]